MDSVVSLIRFYACDLSGEEARMEKPVPQEAIVIDTGYGFGGHKYGVWTTTFLEKMPERQSTYT